MEFIRKYGMVGLLLAGLLGALIPGRAAAGVVEISGAIAFSRSNYSSEWYTSKRRFGASVGYYFTPTSQIEFSFEDETSRIVDLRNVTYHDQIYSANWVQTLGPREFAFKPYLKTGIGQLNRTAEGLNLYGENFHSIEDTLTGVVGVGLRVQVFRALGLRFEGTTYIPVGKLSSWRDNLGATLGFSLYL